MAKTRSMQLIELTSEHTDAMWTAKAMVHVLSCAVTSDLWAERPTEDDGIEFYMNALLHYLDRAEELFNKCSQVARIPEAPEQVAHPGGT
jgi:hypothetical protein